MGKVSSFEKESVNPAVATAIAYLDSLSMFTLQSWKRHLSRIEDNNLSSTCVEIIDKLIQGEKISDIDLLSLAWILRFNLYDTLLEMEQKEVERRKKERENKDVNRIKK